MNDKPETNIGYVSPLKKICMTIGQLPTSYLETMSYYEMLVWFVEFLRNQVIPVVNNNSEATKELQDLFVKLENYVNNYLTDENLQPLIDNKLEEMLEDGTIARLLDETALSNVIYDNKQECVLYCFFDSRDSNRIHFYKSYDGCNLEEIKTNTILYGRDPSITYINGKYYVAVTGYTETYDFVIYESEDLNNWTRHEINVNLYNSTYDKRWGPDWFIDTNGKIYIFISVQYALTDDWKEFRIWRTECTDIVNMTFDTPVQMNLINQPYDSHIDATILKVNDVYHMFVKSEYRPALHLEHYTSLDLLNWQFIESDPGNLGDNIEAPIAFKLNNKYYISGERFTRTDAYQSYYLIKNTTDFINYSGEERIINYSQDISHGGAIVLEEKIINKLLNYEDNKFLVTNNTYNHFNSKTDRNHVLIAGGITVDDTYSGELKGNYLKIFSITTNNSYKTFPCCFQITDVQDRSFDSVIQAVFYFGANKTPDTTKSVMEEISYVDVNGMEMKTLAGRLVYMVDPDNSKMISVYLDLQNLTQHNKTITITMFSNNSYDFNLTYYHDKFQSSLQGIATSWRGPNHLRTLAPNSKTIYIDNTTHTSLTFKCVMRNGNIKIQGHNNTISGNANIYDIDIMVLNGNITLINNNSDMSSPPTATVTSYNSTTGVYEITLSNLGTSSGFTLSLPNHDRNFFTDCTLN